MSTLVFDEHVVPIAKHLAQTKYKMGEQELSAYVAGFVEGWSSRATQSDEKARALRTEITLLILDLIEEKGSHTCRKTQRKPQ